MRTDRRAPELASRLANSREKGNLLWSSLKRIPAIDIGSIANYLHKIPDIAEVVFGSLFPTDYTQNFEWKHRAFAIDDERIVAWITAELRLHNRQISKFVADEATLYGTLLKGNVESARDHLLAMEGNHGHSLWSLEIAFALTEHLQGTEANRKLLESVTQPRPTGECSREFSTIASYMSYKAESGITVERYNTDLQKAVNKDGEQPDDPYRQFLFFNLAFFGECRFTHIGLLLVYMRGASLVDRYMAFIRLAQLVAADLELAAFRPMFRRSLLLLTKKITDARLQNLSLAFGIPSPLADTSSNDPHSGRHFCEFLNDYSRGDYVPSATTLEKIAAMRLSERFSCIDILAKCKVRSNDICLTQSISPTDASVPSFAGIERLFTHLLTKDQQSEHAVKALFKFIFMYPNAAWAAESFGVLMRELRHSLSTGMSRYVTLGELNSSPYGSRIRARAAAHVTSKVQTDSATGDLSLAVLSAAEAGRPGDLDLLLQELPQTRWLKYAAVASLKNRDAEDAAEKLLLLLSVGDQLDTQDAIELLALCVIEHGRPISVVPRIVHALVTLTAYRARVPISSLYDAVIALGRDQPQSPVDSIVYPILLDLQYKLGKKVSEGARTSACEDFLLVCGVERPSELETIPVDIDPAQMIYFLRHVCVPTILDSSVAYGGTREIEDERIKICRRLITLDEENRQAYVDEIASITRRQLIMRDMSDIERSKIHVDTEGVRNLVYAEGQDMYKRFRSLPQVDHDAVRQLVAKVVSERLQSFDGRHLEIILPPTQRTQAFREFYALVRDRFVSSNEYGLDVYLSVGIRHSTLEKHLRSVFEAQNLITRKDQQSHYLPNDNWRTEFSYDIDEEQHARAQAILAEFSFNVDLLIATLKNNWIQVKTEDKNRDGLFDFSISIQGLGSLLTQAMEVSTFEEAVELVLAQLWDTTDRCLVAIRARLHDDLLPKFERLLQNLSQSILAATGPLRPALSSAIAQSRTDIQSQIAHTSEWFARSSALTMADYQFEHAVDIAIEMVKRCYPARPLNLERKFVIDRQLRGDSLVGVVNVLYTALDNVLERSQVVDRAPTVSISMSATDTALDLVIANDVSRDPLKLHAEQELLATIIQDAGLSKASDKVRREGGSGILKISRAIRIDLKGTPKLSAILTATKFELHVSIEGGRVGK